MADFTTKGFNGFMEMVQIEAKKEENFGADFNVENTGDFYKQMAPIITALTYLEDKAISISRGLNIYNAQNEELDNLLYFFPRRQGSKALVKCRVTATAFVDVAAGDILIQSFEGSQFINTERFEIDHTSTKTIEFKALTEGENSNIQPNNIETVIKAPANIIDVQNLEWGEGGLSPESDYEYLKRYQSNNTNGEWALQPIIDAVSKLAGVKSCNGIRNNTMLIDSYGLEPKSIWIVVDGGIKEEIAYTIYNHIHTPDTKGSIEVEVETSVENHKEKIRFDRPSLIDIEYQLIINSYDQLKIENLIEEYLDEAGLGVKISTGTFITEWLCGNGYKYSDFDLKFRKKGDIAFSTSVQLLFNESSRNGGKIT